MKLRKLSVAMVGGALLCACAGLPSPAAPKTRVSADYEASGDVSGTRAFVYGKRTVLQFPSRPLRLTIHDENGVVVPYEREGHYYRLSRKLERFTVWANTRAMSFSAISRHTPTVATTEAVAANPAPLAAQPKDAVPAMQTSTTISTERAVRGDMSALLRLSAAQLDEVRRVIAGGSASAAEVKALHARLNRVEAQLVATASIMVRVQFETAATGFAADDELVRTLVPAAKAAERINVRGRTDARIAGSNDPRIALARALAVRQFLVEHGVDGSKIKVFALSAGDFIAPARTDEGRALNRRVDIELVDRRHAALKQPPERLEGTAP
jgi:outer membrane protein OmpA-like peptidoglycan-associated protein